jgi:chitinase
MALVRKGLAVALAALSVSLGVVAADAAPRRIVGAYYGNWYSDSKPISAIPANTPITHLFYAFALIENGKCVMPAATAAKDFADIRDLKKRKPSLKALISLGGWGAGGFSDAALTAQSRKTLVQSCVDLFFADGTFDGIDLDWEFPVYGGPAEIEGRRTGAT